VKKENGFILLELIIVLFLMAIILGMSTLLFTNLLPSQKLHATVREVSATIREARSLARIHDEKQFVIFDLDAKQYGIEGRGTRAVPENISLKIIDPFAGEIIEGKYQIVFYASGGIEGGTIVLWNDKKTIEIQTDPIAGSVIVK
jgi:type II secretory pathway pseudopilin PulG